jgi:hypothetical protein
MRYKNAYKFAVEAMIRDEARKSAPLQAPPEYEINFEKCPLARAVNRVHFFTKVEFEISFQDFERISSGMGR